MSKSPLSGAFAGSSEPAKKNKKNGALLLISGIALATSIGGVFAANSIVINGGDAIEFGQGIAATSTCDTDGIDSAMSQVYETGDTFRVSEVELTGIDGAACSTAAFRVALIGTDGTELAFEDFAATSDTTRTWTVPDSPVISADVVSRVAVTTE